jgi:putative hemolysin
MPKNFENCVKRGGRVRRKTLKGGKYINICFIDGKSHAGHVHKKGK